MNLLEEMSVEVSPARLDVLLSEPAILFGS